MEQALNNLINVTVAVDGNSANAKLQSDQIKKLYSCGTPENVTPGRSPERYRDDYTWNEVALTDGVAEITYNSVEEALFGKKLHFIMNDGSEYYATLKLKTTAKEAVALSSNGITLTSDNYNLKENTVFEAAPVTKGTDYDNAMSTVGGVSTSAKLFSLSFKANDAAYTPDNRVTLSFDIPEGWNADKTRYMYSLLMKNHP